MNGSNLAGQTVQMMTGLAVTGRLNVNRSGCWLSKSPLANTVFDLF